VKVDLDDLLNKAKADAERLDGRHGDPARLGGWIGHRDHARSVVALISRIRELEALAEDYARDLDGEGYERMAGCVRAVLARGVVLP
jgi:hypothetical protein